MRMVVVALLSESHGCNDHRRILGGNVLGLLSLGMDLAMLESSAGTAAGSDDNIRWEGVLLVTWEALPLISK